MEGTRQMSGAKPKYNSPTKKQPIMKQKVELTDKKTGKVSVRVFRSKKSCSQFMNNWYTSYSFKVLNIF